MEAPTDLETARQLDLLWRRVSEGITKASEGITKADGVLEQAREVRAEVQTGISRAEAVRLVIAELVQQSRLQVEQVQQLSATVEQLHNEVVSAREEIGGQETLEALKQELQDARTTLGKATTQLQETVNEVGGREGLESLRRELQEGREVLSQLHCCEQQLQSGIGAASGTLQEMLQAYSATQETASRVEQKSSEVSNLAQQVRADREAIQSVSLEVDSLRAAHASHINALVQSQHRLRNWLLGVTFAVALALALAIR